MVICQWLLRITVANEQGSKGLLRKIPEFPRKSQLHLVNRVICQCLLKMTIANEQDSTGLLRKILEFPRKSQLHLVIQGS